MESAPNSDEPIKSTDERNLSWGRKFFELRDYTPIPLIILLFVYNTACVLSVVVGLLMVMLGELIRVYSVGFIGSISRTRKDRTGGKLIQDGPFSFVRNPLYVGNFFIATGIAVFGGHVGLIFLTIALFVTQYFFIVTYEEDLLKKTFGEEYMSYCQKVPAWFPSKKFELENLQWPDNFSPAIKSETKTLMTIFAIIFILTIQASI